ncbi:MAG: CPBP family intramembrane metalloprotease domain-containing protein [Oscillatoriales cyanobacterium SM2_3_0]|nr:CPBP family intramembrane metalloprotease domain-containing protein [Oscillatoriales cyanobacterium SM2_3_0]
MSVIGLILFSHPAITEVRTPSNYQIAMESSFNQPDYYPTEQKVTEEFYQPVGDWIGRLILPTTADLEKFGSDGSDWVWIEIYHAPGEFQSLLGQVVRLTWAQGPDIQTLVEKVTTDIKFTPIAQGAVLKGNILPTRLNLASQVGPLRSLAGARPEDDMIVRLDSVTLGNPSPDHPPALEIIHEPIQVTGRFAGLFQILNPISNPQAPVPPACPGNQPCPSDFFRVRGFNSKSGAFDRPEQMVRIPQQVASQGGLFYSTPREIEASPAGTQGWYLYGAKNQAGIFTAQAISPRRLIQLQPETVILGAEAGVNYITTENWQDTEQRKGTIQNILVDPNARNSEEAIAHWQAGDRALVIHSFGGTGGENGDKVIAGTVTGHFAYGIAEVVRDRLTQELQFQVTYQQVYANNPNGITSGHHTWASFLGNMQRGWLGTRPVSDVVIKWEPFTENYDLGTRVDSPLTELINYLQVMTARYRTGDGSGVALVTPTTSCVQDSNQGLYMAIEGVKARIAGDPEIQRWLAEHPDHPQTLRFQELLSLEQDLEAFLAPRGIIRPDWKENSEYLAGTTNREEFLREQNLKDPILSANVIFPAMLTMKSARFSSTMALDSGFSEPTRWGEMIPVFSPWPQPEPWDVEGLSTESSREAGELTGEIGNR